MSYMVRRLEFFVITLWAALTINFILPRVMPGNPAQAMLVRYHGRVSPQTIHTLEVALGLNNHQPIFQQYLQYLGNTLSGNFGLPSPSFHRLSATSSSRGCPGRSAS